MPFDSLPRKRATGIEWTLIHHQEVLASRPVTPGSTVRAARITASRCSSNWPALQVGLVEPRYFPLCVRERSWTLASAPSWWGVLLMAAWTLAFLLARSSLVLPHVEECVCYCMCEVKGVCLR